MRSSQNAVNEPLSEAPSRTLQTSSRACTVDQYFSVRFAWLATAMTDEIYCATCGATILARTAGQCSGLCMPCFKSSHNGRTPSQLRFIRARGDEGIERLWANHRSRRFPAGLGGKDVAGVCVVLLDSSAAGCISTYLSSGSLDAERVRILKECRRQLSVVIPVLQSGQATYFEELSRLIDSVLSKVERAG